jgi:hypothetical protein
MDAAYDGRQVVGIDLHRRRSVIMRMTEAGEKLDTMRIDTDPVALVWRSRRPAPTLRVPTIPSALVVAGLMSQQILFHRRVRGRPNSLIVDA